MCGLYGYYGNPIKDNEEIIYKLIKELAYESEERGDQSVGFFAASNDREYFEKHAMRPSDYFDVTPNLAHSAIMSRVRLFIAHNRKASKGSVTEENAHPFSGKRFVLAHNGGCQGISKFIKQNKIQHTPRPDMTDSEVVLQVLESMKFISEDLFRAISEYAMVIYDRKRRTVNFIRDSERPLYMFDAEESMGVTFFVSTPYIFYRAMEAAEIPYWAVNMSKSYGAAPYTIYQINPFKNGKTRKRKNINPKKERDTK